MNFKVKYYANTSGIVKQASEWHEQPHRYPNRYFVLGELSSNLAPFFIQWPQRLPVVYRSIRGADIDLVGPTLGYSEWLEKVICQEIGLLENTFFERCFWVKHIDEYCSLLLKRDEYGHYIVSERIHDLVSDDKVLSSSIHFLEAVLCVSAYIRGESQRINH